jgi:hypothetical protein
MLKFCAYGSFRLYSFKLLELKDKSGESGTVANFSLYCAPESFPTNISPGKNDPLKLETF